MNWITEYKKSLKNIHAEEPLDIYFFRPIAFVIVKSLYALPITPNQYSFFALVSGMAAGYNFYKGTEAGYQWGAFFFLLFAVLDCCDGMVARLKKNGTEFGRLIDGIVDYTVNMIVYFSLALGMRHQITEGFIQPWMLVILAGISKAFHSISYDHYLCEYISYENGDGAFVSREIEELKNKLSEAEKNNGPALRRFMLRLYLGYSSLQAGNQGRVLTHRPETYCERNLLALKLWSMIGPSFHMMFLIISFLFKMPNVLFSFAIIFGNLWLAGMFLYQSRINSELAGEKIA